MPPIVGGLNHCAAVHRAAPQGRHRRAALVSERATNPVVRWVIDTYGVLPYCWPHWVEFHPQMQWL